MRSLRLQGRRPELLQHTRVEEDLRLPAARQPGGDDVRLDVTRLRTQSVSRLPVPTIRSIGTGRDGKWSGTGPPAIPRHCLGIILLNMIPA